MRSKSNSDYRSYSLSILQNYQKHLLHFFPVLTQCDPEAIANLSKVEKFIHANPNCFSRNNSGHITASAFIVDRKCEKVLLTFHAKLKKWLQLGGHADGEWRVEEVARREGIEESGLKDLHFVDMQLLSKTGKLFEQKTSKPVPFDLDIHLIPSSEYEAEHHHYDFRYLMLSSQPEQISKSDESLDLQWFPLEDVKNITEDKATLKQVNKILTLKSRSH